MKSKHLYLLCLVCSGFAANGQLHLAQNVQIGPGAVMSTTGDVTSGTSILGPGTLLLNGSIMQTLYGNGFTVPALQLDNPANLKLGSDVRIGSLLTFSEGKVLLDTSDLIFSTSAAHSGAGNSRFLVTGGSGSVRKQMQPANGVFQFPVGSDTLTGNYTPAEITNQAGSRDISVLVRNYAASVPPEGNVSSGIDRTWQIWSNGAGNASVALTHQFATEGSAFNRNAAFVTQWNGAAWTTGTPNAGTNGGQTHTNILNIPAALGAGSYFSKSSDAANSLPVGDIRIAAATISAFPNPFQEFTSVRISTENPLQLAYFLTDIKGAVVRTGSFNAGAGQSVHPLPMNALAPGTYLLHLNSDSSNGNDKATIRLTKQ